MQNQIYTSFRELLKKGHEGEEEQKVQCGSQESRNLEYFSTETSHEDGSTHSHNTYMGPQ